MDPQHEHRRARRGGIGHLNAAAASDFPRDEDHLPQVRPESARGGLVVNVSSYDQGRRKHSHFRADSGTELVDTSAF